MRTSTEVAPGAGAFEDAYTTAGETSTVKGDRLPSGGKDVGGRQLLPR